MTENNPVSRYGVRDQTTINNKADSHIEELKNLGYTIVSSDFSPEKQKEIEIAFGAAQQAQAQSHGGEEYLKSIDEHNTIRCPLLHDRIFTDVLNHPLIIEICKRMIGDYIILNQQNGIINPPNKAKYNQGSYHRDLPYQHFTSSRPLAINALYAMDDFTKENGSTFVIPASHKSEPFPSEEYIQKHQIQAEAKAGDFIVLDCMVYHSGGINKTEHKRRAINNVYNIPMLKQQVNLPNILGGLYEDDAALNPLLGYGTQVPDSIETYYKSREGK